MTTPRPLVTIVTPSYNYARFLPDCLESVRKQTYPRIEHIVLDGLSKDGTEEVIRSFAGTYAMQAFFEADRGQADCLNTGFARASGDVFCWLNADDYWLGETVVEEAVSALGSGVDVVTGGGKLVDESGAMLADIAGSYGIPLTELERIDTLLQPATFWRRAVHRPLRDDLQYAFDWRLFLEMKHSGATFRVVPGARWAAYRWHRVNKSSRDPAARKREITQVLKEEWGARSPEFYWARLVEAAYGVAEKVRMPFLKSGMRLVNHAMRWMTGGRIYSP